MRKYFSEIDTENQLTADSLGVSNDSPFEAVVESGDPFDSPEPLISPPADPVATANLISMVDPEKIEPEDVDILADATGSAPVFIEKVLDLVSVANREADETTIEAAHENYSNRIRRLCERAYFSSDAVLEGKTLEEKLTEVVDIVTMLSDNVLDNVESKDIADTISEATGVDSEPAESIVHLAQNYQDELSEDAVAEAAVEQAGNDVTYNDPDLNVADDYAEELIKPNSQDTYIEDNDEYQTPESEEMIDDEIAFHEALVNESSSQNFSLGGNSLAKEVANAWKPIHAEIAEGAQHGARQIINGITSTNAWRDISSMYKSSVQPAFIKVQKLAVKNPGLVIATAVSPLALAAASATISDIICDKAVADEQEAAGNMADAEAMDDSAINASAKVTTSLANSARVNMSRYFVANFSSNIYPQEDRITQLSNEKNALADCIYELGSILNSQQGFFTKIADGISKYSRSFGMALSALLMALLPKFVSVNGNQIIICAKSKSFFDNLRNFFSKDPAWIKSARSLDSYVKDNPKAVSSAFLMALGAGTTAFVNATQTGFEGLPPRAIELLAEIKQHEMNIETLEAELSPAIAGDLANTSTVKKTFSAGASTEETQVIESEVTPNSTVAQSLADLSAFDFNKGWANTNVTDEDYTDLSDGSEIFEQEYTMPESVEEPIEDSNTEPLVEDDLEEPSEEAVNIVESESESNDESQDLLPEVEELEDESDEELE